MLTWETHSETVARSDIGCCGRSRRTVVQGSVRLLLNADPTGESQERQSDLRPRSQMRLFGLKCATRPGFDPVFRCH
jgi:hypothetical protein